MGQFHDDFLFSDGLFEVTRLVVPAVSLLCGQMWRSRCRSGRDPTQFVNHLFVGFLTQPTCRTIGVRTVHRRDCRPFWCWGSCAGKIRPLRKKSFASSAYGRRSGIFGQTYCFSSAWVWLCFRWRKAWQVCFLAKELGFRGCKSAKFLPIWR